MHRFSQSSILFFISLLLWTGHAAAQHAICPQLENLAGQAISSDGVDTWGVVCTDVIEPEFVLFDGGGNILRDPTRLPDIPENRSPEFKTMHTPQGWIVFGRWIDPDFEGKNISTGNTFVHLHIWRLDADGQIVLSQPASVLAPDSHQHTPDFSGLPAELHA